MCPSLSSLYYALIIVTNSAICILLASNWCAYYYHQFHYVSVIITSFTMYLSLSPILQCAYRYHQVWCAYHYHKVYYVSTIITNFTDIIITNFTTCLSSQILLCSYHYHKYRDLIVVLWPRRHGFDHRQTPVEFLVAKVTLEEVVLRIIRILQVSVISPRLIFHLSTTDTVGDTRWRSRLVHSGTSRKVAGSIRDGVIGIFIAITLQPQPLTEMSTRNISWKVKTFGA